MKVHYVLGMVLVLGNINLSLGQKRQDFIQALLQDYDSRIPPNFEKDYPCESNVSLYINSIDSIDEQNMTNTFTKCTTCTTLERQIAKTTCVETRALYRQQKEAHNRRQMMERKYYYGKREESRHSPDQYMSLIIDGMDQAKTNLPHFTGRKPKNMNAADLLKTHVTGVINHGHGGLHTFVDICQYSHDPNLTLNVLLKIFLSTSETCGNKLPATLYMQADNCFRENKNKYVLAFCELLVRCEIFTEIHLSFLIVGHTHEDVDCAFSKISETLRKKEAETLEDFLALLPKPALLGEMLDVKGWLTPAIQDVSGVSRPLHYKFKKVEQAVQTSYKGRHDQPWIQLSGNFLSFVPDGKPTKLMPDYSNIDCDVQMRQVEILQHMFQKSLTLNKWRQFYRSLEDGTFEQGHSSEESWILDHLPRQRQRDQFISVIPEVIHLLQRETEVPEIRLRKRTQETGHDRAETKKARTQIRGAKRITLTASCPMKLHKYPMDRQTCSLFIQSFAFSTNRLIFRWREKDPVRMNPNLELPQFTPYKLETENCTDIGEGNTCLQLNVFLERNIGFYMIQTYIPSVLIVMLSWLSFWLNVDAVPARISLGILTVLTMTTQRSMSNASLPRVSYVKAIDIWMAVCLCFVFAALLEYACVNVLARNQICRNKKKEKQRMVQEQKNGLITGLMLRRTRDKAQNVDDVSRVVFPVTFLVFCVVYWSCYLTKR